LVPVRVLGLDGKPVRGLRKADFVLYDNDQRQVITEFEVHEPMGLSTSSESTVRAAGVLKEVNRKYFFVLDMQGSDRIGNKNAKNAVLTFASSYLQPGDEVCLLTFGGLTGLLLKQYLTADMNKITKAVDQSFEMGAAVGAPKVEFIEVPSDEVDVQSGGVSEGVGRPLSGQKGVVYKSLPGESQSSDRFSGPSWGSFGRSYADFDMSMSELAKALAYIPGSKIIVYFSTRIPNRNVSHLFADANATIFSVNTNSVPPKGGGAYGSLHRREKEDQGHGLAGFADASGGRYFDDAVAADTIARDVADLSGHYYVLGYYVHPSWDGRAHQIKVEASTPGLRVLFQSGYNDPKPFAQWTDIEKQLQLFDLALSDRPVRTESLDLPLEILCRPTVSELNTSILAKLYVDKEDGLPPGKIEAFVFVLESAQKIVATWQGTLNTVSIKTKKLFPYVVTRLQPGHYECRLVFREMETGRSAAARRPFRVPELPTAKSNPLICGPPLLLQEDGGEFVCLSKPEGKGRRRASLMSFYSFLPQNCVPLIGRCGQSEMRALLPLRYSEGFRPQENLAVGLINENDGTVTPVEWRFIGSQVAPNKVMYCLLTIKAIGQDHFQLKITASDSSTGAKESAIISR